VRSGTGAAGAPVLAGKRGRARLVAVRHPLAQWSGFFVVHAVLVALCLIAPGWPLGDVERVYRGWAEGAVSGASVVGITTSFVYPILALVPIVGALSWGASAYALAWLGMVTILDAGAFAFLLGRRPTARRAGAAWWWLGFLLLLGPIALARIDSVTVPLVIAGMLWLRTRPLWGTVLLTLATWVKVWPAAIIGALVVASGRRWRVVAVAAGTSAFIVLIALVLGSGSHVFSFVTQQTERGIQIESPVGALWMWQAAFQVPGSYIYYDRGILTYQVTGVGVDAAITLMTPLLVLAVAVVLLLGWLALRRGASFEQLFPTLVLALVLCMIAFNKVGSPQFISWLAAPVLIGLVLHGRGWRVPALLVAVLAALTHIVYPYLYHLLLAAHPTMVLVLTTRNLMELVVLGWSVHRMWALPQRPYR
jgi:hypothetical protein